MKKSINHWIDSVGRSALLVLLIASCSKFEIEQPSVTVDFSPANPTVGDTVIFTVFHDAQFLAVFPGDSSHEYSKSRGKAILDGGDIENEFLRELTPNTENYFTDFRTIGYLGESIPPEIQTNTLETGIDFDPVYNLYALRLSNPSRNVDSATIAIVNPSSFLWGENKNIEMDIRAIDTVNVSLTFYLEIGGIMANGSVVENLSVSESDDDNFMTYAGEPDTQLDIGSNFDMTPLVEQWVADNPSLADDSLEVTRLIIKIAPLDDSPSVWEDIYISFIEVGFPDLRPFDQGFNIPVDNLSGEQRFGYVYDQPGDFLVTIIATNVDYINRDVDYRDHREPTTDEYDFLRSFAEVVVSVSP